MIRYLRFVLLGLLTVAIGEWQFSVFLRNDLDELMLIEPELGARLCFL